MAVNKRTGSPYWYIQFQYNGQNYIKSSKTTDKKLAVKQEVQWRSQLIEQQQLGYKQALSIKEAFQLYANSKSELISYRNINLWCQRAINHWRDKNFIHEVTSAEVERYRNKLSTASYSNQTIKHALNQVSGTIQYAKRMGYQVSEVQMPTIRLSKGRLNYLTAEDEQRLLAELEPTRAVKGLAPYDQRLPELQKEMQDIYVGADSILTTCAD
ncbi:MAG: hypothetical protein BWK72_18845 [Rhodoferax ferrireducens]|uniref:Core-binding (CB) domain-containing protein n=1 Tax=Rhodoferax ferrireducens TaxID=192843 RepID=A0A1W9KPS0_9BURK|nr:MAG: hypothetical protein BWK72_18845 [Rhodoferax ferrireducens]